MSFKKLFINDDDVKETNKTSQTSQTSQTTKFPQVETSQETKPSGGFFNFGFTPQPPTTTIVKKYDLKQMGLAWQPYGEGHINLVSQIKEVMLRS